MAYTQGTTTLDGLTIGIRSLIERKEVLSSVKKSVLIVDREIRLATRDSVKKRKGKDAWRRPTGQLMRSWEKFFRVSNGGSDVVFGSLSELPYAAMHDTGGTIKAKKKYLAIPLNKGARNRGWPRDWPADELSFGFSKSGHAFLFTSQTMAERRAYTKKRKAKEKRERAKSRKKAQSIGLSGIRALRSFKRTPTPGASPEWEKGPKLAGEPQYLLKRSVKLKGTGYMKKAAAASSIKIAELWADHFVGGSQ